MLSGKFLLKNSKLISMQGLRSFSVNAKHLSTEDVVQIIESVAADGNTKGIETIDEYFRVNFRKLTFDQAYDLLKKVYNVEDLEDSFWIWESIEEALRPTLLEIPYDQMAHIFECFAHFNKGSEYIKEDFYDMEMMNAQLF